MEHDSGNGSGARPPCSSNTDGGSSASTAGHWVYVVPLVVVALVLLAVAAVELQSADTFEDTAFDLAADADAHAHAGGAYGYFDAAGAAGGGGGGSKATDTATAPATRGCVHQDFPRARASGTAHVAGVPGHGSALGHRQRHHLDRHHQQGRQEWNGMAWDNSPQLRRQQQLRLEHGLATCLQRGKGLGMARCACGQCRGRCGGRRRVRRCVTVLF